MRHESQNWGMWLEGEVVRPTVTLDLEGPLTV